MNRLRTTAALAVFAVILWGCAYPKAAEPPAALTDSEVQAAHAKDPGADRATVAAGRDLFVANCGQCHDHPDVMVIDDAKWPEIIEEMGEKAELKKEEAGRVLTFIRAVRAARARSK